MLRLNLFYAPHTFQVFLSYVRQQLSTRNVVMAGSAHKKRGVKSGVKGPLWGNAMCYFTTLKICIPLALNNRA